MSEITKASWKAALQLSLVSVVDRFKSIELSKETHLLFDQHRYGAFMGPYRPLAEADWKQSQEDELMIWEDKQSRRQAIEELAEADWEQSQEDELMIWEDKQSRRQAIEELPEADWEQSQEDELMIWEDKQSRRQAIEEKEERDWICMETTALEKKFELAPEERVASTRDH